MPQPEAVVAQLRRAVRPAGGSGLSSTAIQLSHPWAVEQVQQSLERAAIAGGGVELEGKSASIKSISECIQLSNASSFSSCFVLCSERSICISLAGSRRQLSIDKNERKGESDEPDAPLLLERELAEGEVDVVIGGKQSNQANNTANKGFQQGFAVKPKPPQGWWRIQISKLSTHPKQHEPVMTLSIIVQIHCSVMVGLRGVRPARSSQAAFCSRTETRPGGQRASHSEAVFAQQRHAV